MTGLVDDALLVDDAAITAAMRRLYASAGLVTEPAGAIGVAAVAEHPARFEGRRVATVICGANATPEQLSGWGVV
jgi:threonine dehydratase